jgi:hypothetical protein
VQNDGAFAALAERHLGPVLTRAGFAAGQWGSGSPTSVSYTVDADGRPGRSVTIVEPWREGGTYCADGGEYIARYPHVARQGWLTSAATCVDVVIDGTIERGVDRLDVENVALGDLLRGLGHDADAALVDHALASGDAATALPTLAAVLERLYLPGG